MTQPTRRRGVPKKAPPPVPALQADRATLAIYGVAPEPSACRSCGAAVYFVPFGTSPRLSIINAEPVDGMGSIAIENGVATTLPKKDRKGGIAPDGRLLLKSHFATCPSANLWRKK